MDDVGLTWRCRCFARVPPCAERWQDRNSDALWAACAGASTGADRRLSANAALSDAEWTGLYAALKTACVRFATTRITDVHLAQSERAAKPGCRRSC